MRITRTIFDDSDVDEDVAGVRYDYLDGGYGLWARTYASTPSELYVVAQTNPLRPFALVPYEDPRFGAAVRALLRESGATRAKILAPSPLGTYVDVDVSRLA